MRAVSRRAVLTAAVGVTASGAAVAAGAYGLVEAGVLPGKYRLASILGECGTAPPPPRGPRPGRTETAFLSAYRHRVVQMVTLIPAGAASARGLGVVVALHGLGGDAVTEAGRIAPAMTAAAVSRFAVITVDGGGTYWHRRADGDDPLGMIIHEVLPRAAARGLETGRIGIAGNSMGGYGALLLAERLGAGQGPGQDGSADPGRARAAAVVAASPAIFGSYPDARAADPHAFDGPADFARNNVFADLPALRRVPAWISCGSSDPFAPITQSLRARLARLTGHPIAGGIEPGCHDNAFWARGLPAELQFLGSHLQ